MSFDRYAFIALAPSSPTVTGLISMVKADNDRRQQEVNENGLDSGRSLNVHSCIVTNSLYRVADLFS
jgi:hypothetical protein